ncbi:MAG: hypothetical protein EOM90_16435 [Alphaproteobacteria bacterium]|nr:hypothetical protein [Alphaproteobacteria bacterium]
MGRPILMILSILLILCLYWEATEAQVLTPVPIITEIENINKSTATIEDSVLIENRVMHSFSQMDKQDQFYICIKGKSIIDGKMMFKIIKSDGTVILNEEFPSCYLLNYGFEGDIHSVKDREDFIKSRISDFFNENNFLHPAIQPNESFDEDYSDKLIWDEIKSDQTSIGFSYLIGEEDIRMISFSKKKGKVVMYFNCC